MSNMLRQSTQIIVRIGPFVDVTNAATPETGITLGAADQAEALKANGAATVDISGATWAAVTGCDGWYDLTLTTSHTDTVGELVIVVQDASVCLPVFARFQVIEEAVFDALFAASAAGYQVPIWSSAGATVNLSATTIKTATDIETDTQDIQSRLPAALVSGRIDASVGAMAANVLTASAINADAITAAKVAADVSAEIADAVWDETLAGHLGAGSTGEALNAAGAAGDPWTTALPGAYGAGSAGNIIGNNLDATVSSRASAAALTTVDNEVGAIDTAVLAVKAKTDSLTFTVAGQVDANIQYVNDVQVTGDGQPGTEWGP